MVVPGSAAQREMDDQARAEAIEFNFYFTRYPRDKEPTLSASLGIPGFDPAPHNVDPLVPETVMIKEGYAEKPQVKDEHASFFSEMLAKNRDFVQSLSDKLEKEFNTWEEARSSEVVYRTDGLEKFLQKKVLLLEASREASDFFGALADDAQRLGKLVDTVKLVPAVRSLPQQRIKKQADPLEDVLISEWGRQGGGKVARARLTALRAGWWVRLTIAKMAKAKLLADTPQGKCKYWSWVLATLLIKALHDVCDVKNKSKLGLIGLNSRGTNRTLGGASGPSSARMAAIGTKQLASQVKVHADKFELWEHLASLARAHFECNMVDRDVLLDKLLLEMKNMFRPGNNKDALPLSMCYMLTREVLGYAPFMDKRHFCSLWSICTHNLRVLHWSVTPEAQDDPAFLPLLHLLEAGVAFVRDSTSRSTFRSWERRLDLGGTSAPAPSPRQAPPTMASSEADGLESTLQVAGEEYPVSNALGETMRPEGTVYSIRSGPAGRAVRVPQHLGTAARVRAPQAMEAAGLLLSPSAASRKRPRTWEKESSPAATAAVAAAGSATTTNAAAAAAAAAGTAGLGATGAAGTATINGAAAGNGAGAASQAGAAAGGSGTASASDDAWREAWDSFELIGNTTSLLELLRNAKKVKGKSMRRSVSQNAMVLS